MLPLTLNSGSRVNPRQPWSPQSATSSLMSNNCVKFVSPGSRNQTRPARSQTNIRPVVLNGTPPPSFQAPAVGPGTAVPANPGGTLRGDAPNIPASHKQ